MRDFLIVSAGGALGASARYGLGLLVPWSGAGLPFSTLSINVLGSALMGVVTALALEHRLVMLFCGVGVLGGFTTFSAFSMETVRLLLRGDGAVAALYVVLATTAGVLAAFIGFSLARALT